MIGTAAIDDAKIASLDAGKITTGFLNAARIATGSIDSRIAQITDAQIQSLSAGKIVAAYLSAINANLGTITAGTIDMNQGAAGSWSYIRSAGKWIDANNGFAIGAYQPDGSYFLDVKAGNNQIRMHTGASAGGTNAFINFGNGAFSVDINGAVVANNIYARGNVEATSLNALSANIVSTLHLQNNALIIPVSTEYIGAWIYGNSTWQDVLGMSITLPEFSKMFITASMVMTGTIDLQPGTWGFRLLRHDGTAIMTVGPVAWGGPTEVMPIVTFGRNWAENAGTWNFGVQFWGTAGVGIGCNYAFASIMATRKS